LKCKVDFGNEQGLVQGVLIDQKLTFDTGADCTSLLLIRFIKAKKHAHTAEKEFRPCFGRHQVIILSRKIRQQTREELKN